ncbi:MAG: carboxypeptidase-like regulatory domain-containing protein, partial [Flavisolibacter sp.]
MRKIVSLLTVLMLLCALAYAQTRSVSGRVTDPQGKPIPFASVTIRGTSTGVAADENGNFTIQASPNTVLVFSAAGFQNQEVNIGRQTAVTASLNATSSLNEVVVTALGIRRQAKDVGYSTSTVNNKELNVSKPVNIAQGLVGRVAGAQISTINNGVNPSVRIQLRGERHINADNQALIVVDGMIVRPDFLAALNPEDIENVSILKGASAAALYGSEATNGVMIVTTRRGGERGRPNITFSTTHTLERLSYMPQLQTRFSGYGGESGDFFYGPAIDPYTGFANYAPFENQSYGPEFNNNPALGFIGGPNANGDIYKTPFVGVNPDSRRSFFQTGYTTQNDLSFSGGDRDNSYFIGLQDVNIKGTLPKDVSRRTSARFGGKKTYGIFSADFNLSYAYKTANTAGEDFNGNYPVYWMVLNTPANVPLSSLKNWQDPNSFGNISNYYNAYYDNPYWVLDNARHKQSSDNIQAGLNLNLKPTEWFNATYRVGAQITNTIYKDWRNPAIFSSYAASDPWGASNTASSGNVAGSVNDADYYFKRLQQDIMLNFSKTFGDLKTNLIVGNTIWSRYASIQSTSSSSTYLTDLFNINYRQGEASVGQSSSETRLIGGYGDLTLGWKDYLTVHGNFRRDWSSLLATGKNAYNVWAIDGAFVLSDYFASMKSSNF